MEKFKLACIYNVWGDWDLLEHSIKNIRPLVDGVFIVFSRKSNYGEEKLEPFDWSLKFDDPLMMMIHVEPDVSRPPADSERAKRNIGIHHARKFGYTHFLIMDSDEFYEPEAFLKEKEKFKNPDLLGLVCKTKVYFKSPTLTIGYDTTLVPFIHKMTPDIKCSFNTNYPFAFTGPKKEIRIDPTRQMNISSGVEMSEIDMHHFSWVRSDIQRKIRNSTAKSNIEKSTIVRDYSDGKAGYFCEFYKATLDACENVFNIPENIIDHELIRIHETKSSTAGGNTGSEGLL